MPALDAPRSKPVGPATFTRDLLTRGLRGEVPLPLRRVAAPGGAARIHDMADVLRKDAIGWLCRQGGWRPLQVVVNDRRRQGRVWAPEIWSRLGVRFTSAPLDLIEALIRAGNKLPNVSVGLAERVRRAFASDDPPTGDLLALHRIVSRVLDDRRSRPLVLSGTLGDRLDQLQQTIHRCEGLALLGTDGWIAATYPGPDDIRDGLAAARGLLHPGDPQLKAGDWQPLPGETRPLWITRLAQPSAFLVVALRARTRKFEPDSSPVQQALTNLSRGIVAADVAKDTKAAHAMWENATRRRDLLRLSPLTQLQRIEEAAQLDSTSDTAEAVAHRLAPLVHGDRAVLLSYLDRTLAKGWVESERARQRADTAAAALPRYAAAAAGFAGLVRALGDRVDGLRPLIRYFNQFVVAFGTRDPVLAAYRAQARSYDRASQREDFLAAIGEVFAAGRAIDRAAQDALATAFVDRTEEGKVLMAEYHEGYRELGPEIEAIRRELAGEIG